MYDITFHTGEFSGKNESSIWNFICCGQLGMMKMVMNDNDDEAKRFAAEAEYFKLLLIQ